MFKSGELTIMLILLNTSNDRNHWTFIVKRKDKIICKGRDYNTPLSWSEKRVAEDLLGWMMDTDRETRSHYGWKFTADDIYDWSDCYEADEGTRFIIE